MNKTTESYLLKFREMTKAEQKLTDEEKERFENVDYNRIYNQLKIHNKNVTIKAINPYTGEVFYDGDHDGGRFNMTSLGYGEKENKKGIKVYVMGPGLFEKKEQSI
ncbi:MAG: hypothetical protein Q7J54_06980 [Candidatus Woesearchaeota archaeon]|nr:hypothetical protein [Candidatus Woesearchaeota archaeon]